MWVAVSLGSTAGVPSRDAVARVPGPQLNTTPTNGHGAQQIRGAFRTSPAVPHETTVLPGCGTPTYEDYKCCIPERDRWKLDKKVDFERDNIDLHLGELAMVFEKWEDIAPLLGLSNTEVGDIIKDFRTQAEQR